MVKMNSSFLWIEQLKFNSQGLIPAIAQDYRDHTVLMMAWMNREAIQRTLETGEAHYWSRSRGELWHKGATSGHIQKVKEVYYDCDADTLLLKIEQVGNVACHTGARSCFFNRASLPTSITSYEVTK
jgi:phosphoribosyl-AMP cyclohydrolase/phosphoribosyl-ATP pyrophosphohydrolase/phosphoribosyl-AMP cyclohydrolase